MAKGTIQRGDNCLIDCAWFENDSDIIGLVIGLNSKTRLLRAAIGRGNGENEVLDALNILSYGAPFPIKAAMELFGEELNEKVEVKQCELYGCIAEILKSVEHNLDHPSWKRYVKGEL